MKTLFSNKLFFLIFFLLISVISSENKKENSLEKKSNEEADNNKAEKSSENKIERKSTKKERSIKDEKNSKEMPEKSDKDERKKEDENKSEDKPKHLNEGQNKDKKNDDENNTKEKPENSNEKQDKDKNKDENNKEDKDEENEDDKKKNKKKKKDNDEEEDDENKKKSKKKSKKKRKSKKDSEEDKMDEDENKRHKKLKKNKKEDSEKGEKKEKGEEEEKGEKRGKKGKKNKNKKCEAILLGFDTYEEDKDEDNISFNIYFVPVDYYIKANKLKVPLKFKLKESSLRALKDEKKQIIECKKKYKKGEKQIRFKCVFEKKNRKIEKIEVDVNKFKFIGQEVKIKSCSPLAMKNMKNLQKVGKRRQFKNKIYILDNAELKQNEKNFNIIGKIKDKDFDEEEVTLKFLDSKKKESKIDCKIKKNKGKYIFECEPKNDINGNFDGAYGDFEDKNIVINFKKDEDSEINFIVEKKEEKKEKKNKKKKEDDNDDNDENKNSNKKKEEENNDNESNKESNREMRKRHRKKKEDDDDLQFVYEKNVKIDILIYICIGFIILLLITLAYNCIVQSSYKGSSKSYFDNNSMDTVKLSTQSNE